MVAQPYYLEFLLLYVNADTPRRVSSTPPPRSLLPVSIYPSGNFQTNGASSFMDRYVILVGGYQYKSVYHANGTTTAPYGQSQRMCPPNATGASAAGCRAGCSASKSIVDKHWMGQWKDEYDNDVFVYDAKEKIWGTVRALSSVEPSLMPPRCGGLPINDNLPQTNVHKNQIFVMGGECNGRVIAADNYTHYPRLGMVGEISVIGG